MLFWIGERSPQGFRVFVSVCIVGGNVLFTSLVLFVFVRAFVRESRKKGDQSELALKSILRMRSRHGQHSARSLPHSLGSKRVRSRGSIDRNGTIKGSLRYNAKVALQLKRAQANVQSYAKSSHQMKRLVEKKREQATTRLKSRLIKRASKSGKSLARVRDASGSITAVVLPVQGDASDTAEKVTTDRAMDAQLPPKKDATITISRGSGSPSSKSILRPDDAARLVTFFKKIGVARTLVLAQKLTVTNVEGGLVLNEAKIVKLFRQKLRVQDTDAVVEQMRSMGKGVGGQVTPEGFCEWASKFQ
jgi:hypothetical protein